MQPFSLLFVTEEVPIAARTLGLVVGRHVNGGLHEDIDITNNSQKPVRFNLEIANAGLISYHRGGMQVLEVRRG